MILNPATMFAMGNGSDIDFDMSFYTLEEAIDMVEFQESLVEDVIDWEDLEVEKQ